MAPDHSPRYSLQNPRQDDQCLSTATPPVPNSRHANKLRLGLQHHGQCLHLLWGDGVSATKWTALGDPTSQLREGL